jgi:hypothetical protein
MGGEVSAPFSRISDDVFLQLQEIPDLVNHTRQTCEEFPEPQEAERLRCDGIQLGHLTEFVKFITDIMKFIRIISIQKSQFFDVLFSKLDRAIRKRLLDENFFEPNSRVLLMDTIQEFSRQIFAAAAGQPGVHELAAKVSQECPTLLQIVDIQISEAMANLQKATRSPPESRTQSIDSAVAVFLEYADRDLDISGICFLLFELEALEDVVRVVSA